jgi:uncharacterized protein YndB with AHSA1/START domain
MAKVNVTHDMPASAETVFGIFADAARRPEWLTIHDGWKDVTPGQLAEGTKFSEKCTVMGMTNSIGWTVEEFVEPKSLTISGNGLAGAKITFVLSVESRGDGSTAVIDAEFTGQMVVGAIGLAIERSAKKEVQASLEKLADLVG